MRNDLYITGIAHRDHPYRLQQIEPMLRFCVSQKTQRSGD
jgi:hypothetical protein